jgi:uncharacterized membrane protein YsdA (DUF1294 family)
MLILILCYILINLAGFILMKIDKERARNHHYRISEKTLWLTAIFGGAAGMTLGMNQFRHKTKHLQFKIGLPVLGLAELGLILYIVAILS